MHDNGADQPLVWYEGSAVGASNRRHLFANWQRSITAITDSAGAAIGVNAYDAYGIPNDTNIGRFQYTGQMWIRELGLYHYKARAYSPTLGRFMQTDPIGYEDAFNLYTYVANRPVAFVDPSGKTCTKNVINGKTTYSCKIDLVVAKDSKGNKIIRAPTKKEEKRFASFNKRYTAAVNQLMENPDASASVPELTSDGKGAFTITAGEAAGALESRVFVFVGRTASGGALETQGGPGTSDKLLTKVTQGGLARAKKRHIVHDGLHGTSQENSGGLQDDSYPLAPGGVKHQKEYDKVACKLLGAGHCVK